MDDWEILETFPGTQNEPKPKPESESDDDSADKIIEELEKLVKESESQLQPEQNHATIVKCLEIAKNVDWRLNIIYTTMTIMMMLYKNKELLTKLLMTAQISYKTFVFYNSIWKRRYW